MLSVGAQITVFHITNSAFGAVLGRVNAVAALCTGSAAVAQIAAERKTIHTVTAVMYFVNTATAGFAMRFFKVKYTMSAVIAKSRVRCTYSARTAFLTLKLISAYRTRVVTERAYKCAVITCTARLTYVFPRFTFAV